MAPEAQREALETPEEQEAVALVERARERDVPVRLNAGRGRCDPETPLAVGEDDRLVGHSR